jgi:hypothetical protein
MASSWFESEGRSAMKKHVERTPAKSAPPERGFNLDVPGRALIAQADERIKWHKRTAATMEAELKAMPMQPGAPVALEDWKQHSRRTDIEAKMNGHLEYARFLTFVRRHIARGQTYRLGLTELSFLEIMPKGSYH